MNVYVESNFVLELALPQEQHESCSQIVDLAGERHIHLVIPAYSLVEPYETLTRHFKERQAIIKKMDPILGQLGRSAPYEEQTDALQDHLTVLFIGSKEEEGNRLRNTLEKLLEVAELIPLTTTVINNSLQQQQQDFSPQDAVVYSSVLEHLADADGDDHVFLNRNSKDFDDPDVQDRLEEMGCKILFRFDDGIGYIRHRLDDQEA